MADKPEKKKPEKIHISPAAARKLRKAAGSSLPKGKEGDDILSRIVKKLRGDG